MCVVVQFHRQVRDNLERWLGGLELADANRALLVRVYLDELTSQLERTAGQPPGAVRVGTGEPQLYRWQYTDEVEIGYEVRTQRHGLLRALGVRIVVTEIRLAPAA